MLDPGYMMRPFLVLKSEWRCECAVYPSCCLLMRREERQEARVELSVVYSDRGL